MHFPALLALTLGLIFPTIPTEIPQDATTAPSSMAEPSPTAGEVPSGVLWFTIKNERGASMPGRLTFVGDHAPGTTLFPNVEAAPDDLAVRDDLVSSLSGEGAITVPVGTYRVIASRGLEYSIAEQSITITEGGEAEFNAVLEHEIDTTGWVSADFHLHTLTYSGHGDANLKERMISILGEGLEVAVATDHNHHTDYAPTMRELGVDGTILTIVGNEISTPIGHFNAFPVNPNGPLLPSNVRDAPTLFSSIRGHDSGIGLRALIQVNHPRWAGIDYFAQCGLDPLTGVAVSPAFSRSFDSVEILNENACWGYYEAGAANVPTEDSRFSVLQDWFNLLDRGEEITAVGNSDSHSVRANIAGVPRNFVTVDTDSPEELEPRSLMNGLRRRKVFTTTGPFLTYTINGLPGGSKVVAKDGQVELKLRLQAASWIDVDRVLVIVNGDRVLEIPVPEERTPLRLEHTEMLALPADCWIVLLAEGDDSLAPVIPDTKRPIRPLTITNPVWVELEGDTQWIPPAVAAERAAQRFAEDPEKGIALWRAASPANRRRLLIGLPADSPVAPQLAREGLADEVRRVRLAALHLIDRLDDASFDTAVAAASETGDVVTRVFALRAIHDRPTQTGALLRAIDRDGMATLSKSGYAIDDLIPGDFVRKWRVLGYFNPTAEGKRPTPETATNPDQRFIGKTGEAAWEVRETRRNGYLDLLGLVDDPVAAEQALAYAEVWITVPEARTVRFTLGTDDGCVLFLNGKEILRDTETHAADPLAHAGTLDLVPGPNRLLLRVENGRGGFGAYFRILDNEIKVDHQPPR